MTTPIKMDKKEYTGLFKCTRCGQCTYGKEDAEFTVLCPVHKKGHFFTYSAGGMMQIARNLYEGKIEFSAALKDIVFSCTTCGVCEVNCGVIENHLDIITRIRKQLVEMDFPESVALSQVNERIFATKNPYGYPHDDRTAWLKKNAQKLDNPDADIVYFTGCVSAYDQKQIPRALDGILSRLDISYTIFSDEHCCGGPLFFSGEHGKAAKLARHNMNLIEKSSIKTVVASCPTCALMLKKHYPEWTGKDLPFRVLHTTQYLETLMDQGRLTPGSLKDDSPWIYHDSCHLGRGLGIYKAPRKLLNAVGHIHLTEFDLNGENSLCCGGGGMMPVLNQKFSFETATQRLDSIPDRLPDNEIRQVVSACPNCRKTLGLSAKRARKKIKVKDVCELIFESMA